MPRMIIRLAVALLTFTFGLAAVWLTDLGSRLADAALERLMPTPTLDSDAELSCVDQLTTDLAPVSLDADTYEVYDALLNGTGATAHGRLVVIKAETSGYDREEEPVLRREDGGAATFAEDVRASLPAAEADTLDNYLAVNRQPHALVDLFQLRTKHTLITEADMKVLAGQRELYWMWEGFYRKYPDAGGWYGLSTVGFNRPHTQAFVYFWHACGGDCGGGSYVLLEKWGGAWRIVDRMGLWVS